MNLLQENPWNILHNKCNPCLLIYTTSSLYTTLGTTQMSKSGPVTEGRKVTWGKYAQVTNDLENDESINAILPV